MEKETIHGGLLPEIQDERDLEVGGFFTLPKLSEVADEFVVGSLDNVLHQKNTDYCATHAGCDVSKDQEGIDLDPCWQFMLAKQIDGNLEGWGLQLRDMAKSFTKFGSIEKKDSPYTVDTPRSVIVNPKSWFPSLLFKAEKHKKESYLKIKSGR